MEDGAKAFVKEVKSLNKKVRDEDVFRGVDSNVKNFLTSVPLVADLRSPAMRDRHWEQLMSTTKVRPPLRCAGCSARCCVLALGGPQATCVRSRLFLLLRAGALQRERPGV